MKRPLNSCMAFRSDVGEQTCICAALVCVVEPSMSDLI